MCNYPNLRFGVECHFPKPQSKGCNYPFENVYVQYTKFCTFLNNVYMEYIELCTLFEKLYTLLNVKNCVHLKNVYIKCTELCTFFKILYAL